jgi:hypothetical protein
MSYGILPDCPLGKLLYPIVWGEFLKIGNRFRIIERLCAVPL